MHFRRPLCILLLLSLSACRTPYKEADEAEKQPLKNMVGDTAFQAFIGRLRIAVKRRDAPMISSLMTSDFGYSLDEGAQPGAHVFAFWEQNQLWPVLSHLLDQKFVPLDLYMVSPPAMALDPNYAGPRCGMRMVGGSWKFAYFLPN